MEKNELVEVMREVLHEHRQIDDEKHSLHHEYIEMEILRRERRHEAWKKFKLSFIGGSALALLGFLGWIGKLILESLHIGTPH